MRSHRLGLALVLFLSASLATAQDPKPKQPAKKATNPAYEQIQDVPGLPRVLILGDSISIGYTLPTRELLKDVANVHRPATNCGPTTNGIQNIDAWLGKGKWDVIHFNFGLHDLKYIDENGKNTSPEKGKVQVPIDAYKKNLDALVTRMSKTGAKLIFATTTPVPEGEPQRKANSDEEYNKAALEVMEKHKVAINDLDAFVRGRKFDGQLPKNVHFTPAGSKALAEQVAGEIKKALGK